MGLIVIGYQGIGKSSIAGIDNGIIDLESSLIKEPNGSRPVSWYKIYCDLAKSFADQGYTVCISSHACVYDELIRTQDDKPYSVVAIFPALELREEWLSRLSHRLGEEPTQKNWVTYLNAEKNFTHDITKLSENLTFPTIQITTLDFDLKELLDAYKLHLTNSVES